MDDVQALISYPMDDVQALISYPMDEGQALISVLIEDDCSCEVLFDVNLCQ